MGGAFNGWDLADVSLMVAGTLRLGIIAAVLAAGCDRIAGSVSFFVDGIRFSVPVAHLTVAGEPASGFSFVLDPLQSPSEQVLVTVEPRAIRCRADKVLASPILSGGCDREIPPTPPAGTDLERQFSDPYGVHWNFSIPTSDIGASATIFATCAEIGTQNKRARCYSMGRYRDIVYLVDYPETEVGQVGDIRRSVERLLLMWERPEA